MAATAALEQPLKGDKIWSVMRHAYKRDAVGREFAFDLPSSDLKACQLREH
jgi:hypothetical protein